MVVGFRFGQFLESGVFGRRLGLVGKAFGVFLTGLLFADVIYGRVVHNAVQQEFYLASIGDGSTVVPQLDKGVGGDFLGGASVVNKGLRVKEQGRIIAVEKEVQTSFTACC